MSYSRDYHVRGGPIRLDNPYPLTQNSTNIHYRNRAGDFSLEQGALYMFPSEASGIVERSYFEHARTDSAPSMKRRKHSSSSWESYWSVPSSRDSLSARFNAPASTTTSCKRDRSQREDDELVFLSRDEIERLSPSRRDGIDVLRETHLRYSYCAFLQDLGQRLELPQTTIGTAMVLCHRFFVRRSHACHDRFLIATATLFLAAKSEETTRPLNTVLRLSCEIYYKQDISFLSYLLPLDWFEQYRERVTDAEQLVLTTLNFELNVQHPFTPLMSIFNKLGLSQSMLLNVALSLISEGVFARLALICMIFLAAGLMCCHGKFCFTTGVVVYSGSLVCEFITSDLLVIIKASSLEGIRLSNFPKKYRGFLSSYFTYLSGVLQMHPFAPSCRLICTFSSDCR